MHTTTTTTVPVNLDAPTPSGDRCNQPVDENRLENSIMTQVERLSDAVTRIDLTRAHINAVIRDLPDDSPMFVIVDIVNALWNLRNAAVLLDKATDALEADAQAVQR